MLSMSMTEDMHDFYQAICVGKLHDSDSIRKIAAQLRQLYLRSHYASD